MSAPNEETQDRTPQRGDFARALTWLMEERSVSQRELASRLGRRSYGPFYRWFDGSTEPTPDEVFRLERALDVPPGTLSRHLGYLPPEARFRSGESVTFEEFIRDDPSLNDLGRRTLAAVYREVSRKPGGRATRRA